MAISPAVRKMIHQLHRSNARFIRDHLAERENLAARVRECAEDGMVCIVSGGRDCDGSQWDGRISRVVATPRAVMKWIDDMYEWADGPRWAAVKRPSECGSVRGRPRPRAVRLSLLGRVSALPFFLLGGAVAAATLISFVISRDR
jgi:hypothetical protein